MDQDRKFRQGFYAAPGSVVEMDGVAFDGFDQGGFINGASSVYMNNVDFNECAQALQVAKSKQVSLLSLKVDGRVVSDIRGDFEVLSVFSDELIIQVALKVASVPKKQRRHVLKRSEIGRQINVEKAQTWLNLANAFGRLGEYLSRFLT